MNYLVRNAQGKSPKYLEVLKEKVDAEIKIREARPRGNRKGTKPTRFEACALARSGFT